MERDIRAAGAAVAAAAGELGWSQSQLAQRAGVDSGTLGDFLAGRRWPRNTTQFKVEKALGWRPGSIARIADGGDVPVVRGNVQDPTPDMPVGSGVDPELLTELADADPAAIEAVRAVLRAARRGD